MGEAFDLKNSPCPGLPTQNTEEADVVVGTPPIPGRARTNLLRHSRSYLCPRIEPLASENLRPPGRSGTLRFRNRLKSGISRTRGTTPSEPFVRGSWRSLLLILWFLGDHPGSPSCAQYGDESLCTYDAATDFWIREAKTIVRSE